MKQRREIENALVAELKTSSLKRDLQWGKRIHQKATETRNDSNIYVLMALIKMYTKCGSMVDARRLFDGIHKPDLLAWTALLQGYVANGDASTALETFSKMKSAGCHPDSFTYVSALKACIKLAADGKSNALQRGKEIHKEIGRHTDFYVENTLVEMYAKCGSMKDARRVFEGIQKPNIVSWTALLLGYVDNGEPLDALEMFSKMKAIGCSPDSYTYMAALKACTLLAVNGDCTKCLKRGKEIHSEIGAHMDPYVQSTLIDMYAKCGSMIDARHVFDCIKNPVLVSWNALIMGYAEDGKGHAALDMFARMKERGCVPNPVTYVAALRACISLALSGDFNGKMMCLERGRNIHSEIGFHTDQYVKSTLIDMYGKCGKMAEANKVFNSIEEPQVVCWTALILGYAENGEGLVALDLFARMKEQGCARNSVTYGAALKACMSLALGGDKSDGLERGRQIHSDIGKHLNHQLQNTLIDMYAKCGSLEIACRVFDDLDKPDVVSWNTLLLGYAENGKGDIALDLFSTMKAEGVVPNSVTYLAVLKACGSSKSLALGKKFHSEITEFTSQIVTCLIDFYAKCGNMVEARKVFDSHTQARCVPAWNSLLAGYSGFGDIDSVFKLFKAMQDEGFRPDAITFVYALLCCVHAGLVEKAREYFNAMTVYGVTPTILHYTCMVDVLGRTNHLNDVVAVLRGMPCDPDAVAWRALLDTCRKWKNVEIGRLAFQSLLEIDKHDAAAYVLMGHIFGSMGMLEEQKLVLRSKSKFAEVLTA